MPLAGLIPCQARAMAHLATAQHQPLAAQARTDRGFGYPEPLLLSAELQPRPPGSTAGNGARKGPGYLVRQSKGMNTATGTRQSKAFKERRAAFHPTPACSPAGFRRPVPCCQQKELSSSHSKHWLCEEVAKASKALREISIVPFTCNTLRRHLE